jgi:hypothetical protein
MDATETGQLCKSVEQAADQVRSAFYDCVSPFDILDRFWRLQDTLPAIVALFRVWSKWHSARVIVEPDPVSAGNRYLLAALASYVDAWRATTSERMCPTDPLGVSMWRRAASVGPTSETPTRSKYVPDDMPAP